MSDREQLQYQVRAYLMQPRPSVGEQLADRLAFALMWLAAVIDRKVWMKQRYMEVRRPSTMPALTQSRYRWKRDGWRPARYV